MRRIGEIIDELDLKGKNDELIDELVALSTKHGILTPYTSFLADETAKPGDLADVRENRERADRYLQRLSQAEGKAGVAQRAEKQYFKEANQAAAPAADALQLGAAAKAQAGRGGAPGAGGIAAPSGGYGNVNRFRDIDTDEEVVTSGVQQIGNEAVYRRGKTLIATNAKDIDLAKDDAKIKNVQRFSDEYFKLVEANTESENAILAVQQPGEELVIKLRGQAYRIR
jgi:Ca-activated chloride channel family protein